LALIIISSDIIIGPEPQPKCECHGIDKTWHTDNSGRSKNGGYWRCKIKKKESDNKYRKTEKRKISTKRYSRSQKKLDCQKRYDQTVNGYMKKYFSQRERRLKAARIKTIEELEDIRNQLRELGLEPR
jgi:hypothetical protein